MSSHINRVTLGHTNKMPRFSGQFCEKMDEGGRLFFLPFFEKFHQIHYCSYCDYQGWSALYLFRAKMCIQYYSSFKFKVIFFWEGPSIWSRLSILYGVIQFCERTWRWKVEDNAPWHQNFTRMSNLARNKCHAFADQR